MNDIPKTDPHNLPRRLDSMGAIGTIFVQDAEHFIVEEHIPYEPCRKGEHLFVQFRKRDLTTKAVVDSFAKALGIRARDVGVAGMKDKKATTTQWISIQGIKANLLDKISIPGVSILQRKWHRNKLRNGQVKHNTFRIGLKDIDGARMTMLQEMINVLQQKGIPNFYGPQRFGKFEDNREQGLAMIKAGEGVGKSWREKLLLSSYQSGCFNDLLAYRMSKGYLDTALAGDVLQKHDSGGSFHCEVPAEDQPRVDALEISPTGWMPGYKAMRAKGRPGEWEEALLSRDEIHLGHLEGLGKLLKGTRRAMRMPLAECSYEEKGGLVWLTFSLPAGVYASVVLHELGITFVS